MTKIVEAAAGAVEHSHSKKSLDRVPCCRVASHVRWCGFFDQNRWTSYIIARPSLSGSTTLTRQNTRFTEHKRSSLRSILYKAGRNISVTKSARHWFDRFPSNSRTGSSLEEVYLPQKIDLTILFWFIQSILKISTLHPPHSTLHAGVATDQSRFTNQSNITFTFLITILHDISIV